MPCCNILKRFHLKSSRMLSFEKHILAKIAKGNNRNHKPEENFQFNLFTTQCTLTH